MVLHAAFASHVGVSLEEGRQKKQKMVGSTFLTKSVGQKIKKILPVPRRTRSDPTSGETSFAGKGNRGTIGSVETHGGTTRNVCGVESACTSIVLC